MIPYILRRLLLLVPVLFGIITITFILMFVIPGDPIQGMVGERATKETIESIRRELGLHRHILVQYGLYILRVIRGDLGRSYWTGQDVFDTLCKRFPNTLRLAFASMVFAVVIGLALGILPFLLPTPWMRSLVEKTTMVISTIFVSTPVFWFGLLLIYLFSIRLGILPSSGMGRGELTYLILPALTLGTRSSAFIARITHTAMAEAMAEAHIRTARAKGLGEWVVVMKHALKGALIPIITMIGLDLGSYLNGSVLTETIFGWPGIGRYAWEGIIRRDLPVVMGSILFGAVIFVFVNLCVDIIYHYIDPRVRVKGQ
jgi:ABC-type dipeptide/oligopeptide/nickel transport system permease component